MKSKKPTIKEMEELAGLIYLIDVDGQTSTRDNLRRIQLENKMCEEQNQAIEDYLDNTKRPSEKGILKAIVYSSF